MRLLSCALLLLFTPLHASVLGSSVAADSLTAARVQHLLPPAERPAWLAYLHRSEEQEHADRAALAAERAHLTGPVPPFPKEGFSARSLPLDREPAYYSSPEALRIARTVVSFQIPNGGWSKNLDMTAPARLPGQSYTPNNLSHFPGGPDDFDAPRDPAWNYVGTLDNDATNTELRFLLRVIAANPGPAAETFRQSFLRGVAYLLAAQYPNGGWPQVWPLEGGYHDAITFNDNAVTESAELLETVAEAKEAAFVPASTRQQAATAAAHALALILRTQVVVAGKPTVWAQQHDALTLLPVAGRNFEPAALSAGESSDILLFLMRQPHPSPAVRTAITSGIAWLRANAIYGEVFVGGRSTPPTPANPAGGRHLEAAPNAGPLWPRYTAIQTGKPVFGDRDKTVHDNVMDLSLERRNGYAWYTTGPEEALKVYTTYQQD